MKRLGGISIEDELNGFDVNRLDNVLTMDSALHDFFDKLKIWFEETVSKAMLVLHTNNHIYFTGGTESIQRPSS